MTEKFKVGDNVIYNNNNKDSEMNNKKAVVIAVGSNSSCPYLIEFENGYQWWSMEKNVHSTIIIKEINWRQKC